MKGSFTSTICVATCLTLGLTSSAFAQTYPDGTLVMSRLRGPFGNGLSRVSGTYYTHTAVVIDGQVCEATWPRAKCTPAYKYAQGKPWTIHYYPPTQPLNESQVAGLRRYVHTNIGRPYGLRQFFARSAPPDGRIYCSQFAYGALAATGQPLPVGAWHTPDKLLQATRFSYQG